MQMNGDENEVSKLRSTCEELEHNVEFYKKKRSDSVDAMNKMMSEMN